MTDLTIPPEQIEAALVAFAHASGLGIFPDDEKNESWDEDLVDGMRAAISAMRPFIRAEALEGAAQFVQDECHDYDDAHRIAAAIRSRRKEDKND
jgi:hypothetical protein